MEMNLCSYIPTGRMNSEKIMEDGNIATAKDDRNVSAPLGSSYSDRGSKLTANGHDSGEEPASPPPEVPPDDPAPKRINPLRIHLGKRPFVDNSPHHHPPSKKKKTLVNKQSDLPNLSVPRVPKLIPRRELQNVSSQRDSMLESERDKPVPRLVPKSQLLQFKKDKAEKGSHLKHTTQNLGLQPMLNFKCRKCCTTFKTLALLKEHQLVCRAQGPPACSADAAPAADSSNGSAQSRVTRKVYLCSACGTYYENWNLFLHMREVHNRHICLFCLGMFSKAEKLSAHLTSKHRVKEVSYSSKEELCEVYDSSLYLMCCTCEEICSEKDDFFNHDCDNVKPKPVPVLVKTAVKPNSAKTTVNGPPTKPPEKVSDKRVSSETKPETLTSQSHKMPTVAESEQFSDSSAETTRNQSNLAVPGTLDKSILKETLSIPPASPDQSKPMHNGDDSGEESEESDSPRPDSPVAPAPAPVSTPMDKEREGGIKLKLSLNNAKAPVIINSTVDPTVGTQHLNKPPPRNRKLPKRYERERQSESPYTPTQSPYTPTQPRMPSIKMTICDKADNSFVKATIFEDTPIFENTQDVMLRGLLNNNLETLHKTPELKPDNRIKSTIYDNKIEDENSLNRVPKLTVRVPKELLDKDSSSDYSSDSDTGDKLTVDENITTPAEPDKPIVEQPAPMETDLQPAVVEPPAPHAEENKEAEPLQPEDIVQTSKDIVEPLTEPMEQDTTVETTVPEPPPAEPPATELTLDRPIDKYPLKELLKVFLQCTVFNCIYCNHVRKIAVNCEQLCLHMAAEHRFRATVDSITAEELLPDTIAAKVRASAPQLRHVFINLDSYDSEHKFEEVQNDYLFECFQCYFKTAVHKDLYSHNRKMHQKTILLCVMCKCNFYSYSELLCHLCLGTYDGAYEPRFRCCVCPADGLPSAFRLMVHLRKQHHTCDVCLEPCGSQARLSSHVWKHKLHHLCYRCGIAYHNKPDITNHLFWKHGTQSVLCKRCLQKKWPHVYHFCSPPAVFICDECSLKFSKAVYLKVHKRFHSNEFPHACTEEGCTEKFVSKKLLAKHLDEHRIKLLIDLTGDIPPVSNDAAQGEKQIPVIDLVDDDKPTEAGPSDIKNEAGTELISKKSKKKKMKDKDALLLDVNLPELNLSESDSSDESDSGAATSSREDKSEVKEPLVDIKKSEEAGPDVKAGAVQTIEEPKIEETLKKPEEKSEVVDEKPNILKVNLVNLTEKEDNIDTKANPVEEKVIPVMENVESVPDKVESVIERIDPVVETAESVERKAKSTEGEVKNTVDVKSDLHEGMVVENQAIERTADFVETKSNSAETTTEPVETKTDSLEANSDTVETKADTVKLKADSIERKADTVETKADTVETKADTVETKADTVESKANTVESKANTVESKANTVESKANTVESKADSIEEKADTVETRADPVEGKPDLVKTKLDSVEVKADSVEQTTAEMKTSSLGANTDTAGLKAVTDGAKVDSVEAKADSVEAKADFVEAKADSVEAKADSVEDKLDTVEAKTVGLKLAPVESKSPVSLRSFRRDKAKSAPIESKSDPEMMDIADEEKQVLQIWDNFKKYQETVEKPAERLTIYDKPKEKTPPLLLIRKHVCDSDHDYCLIPTDFNGGEDSFNSDKKKNKKAGKKKHAGLSSTSSSSSDSDSSCSCGSNCSCSSSSGSSSSSSDSDSSDDSAAPRRKDKRHKKQGKRRVSTGSNVDVLGVADTPVLVPEPVEPPVAETDLDTDESDTDEEFYDEHPQKIANQLFAEKRNQLMMLASMAPSEVGSASEEASRPVTPPVHEPKLEIDLQDKTSSSKKKSKKKKKSKSSKKREPIKINIPKDIIAKSEIDTSLPPLVPNKITISLQSNTVHIPEAPVAPITTPMSMHVSAATSADNKRSSKRRRVPNKFYGYSSDEEAPQAITALKPTLPPKLEWRKEDLPSPVSHRPRKELPIPSTVLTSRLLSGYGDVGRLTAPVPGPEPPRNLMSAESSESESSGSEGDGGGGGVAPIIPPPSYLMSGTSSLPYAFQRPAVRQAREGESVYCYCRCPYDEVSEMIACDAEGCPIEWFHFECVGIMVPPKGKWYCPECRKNQSLSGYR